jgi:N-acetyl-alpha-D-glucosaminyl L-malate synthase BshA
MKIGIVCYPSIGGSGIVATNLGLELAKMGHEIHFISYDAPFKLGEEHPGIRFHKVHINEYSLFKYPDYTMPLAVAIEEVQKYYKLDIIHVHYAVPHATAALLAKRIMRSNKIAVPKLITTLHGTDITLLARDPDVFSVIKYSVENSDGVTAVSQDLKNETIRVLKTKKPIKVIYNFYSPPTPKKSRSAVRKELKVKDDETLAIHSSNLRPVKRIPDLLKIAELTKNPNFKLLILAGGDFSPYKALAKKLGKKLIVKPNVKDIENYFNASDLGIYPSETESFGMGILEAMSYGTPILASYAGGIPEVVDEGKTGFLLPVGDVKGFVRQLNVLLDNANLRHAMGQQAKKTACEKFCSKTVVPQYLEYYKKIIG